MTELTREPQITRETIEAWLSRVQERHDVVAIGPRTLADICALALQALEMQESDLVAVPREQLIEALENGRVAINDDYRRPDGQIPFDTNHRNRIAAIDSLRAMISAWENRG